MTLVEKAPEETFNSLSRDHRVTWREGVKYGILDKDLSTPSLGITIQTAGVYAYITVESSFQLPLSGSQAEERGPRVMRDGLDFQLPLSGSPSPIPGFSGSPRLSAAAPLRTNDF